MAPKGLRVPEEDLEKLSELFQEADAASTKLAQYIKSQSGGYSPSQKKDSTNLLPVGIIISMLLTGFGTILKLYSDYTERVHEVDTEIHDLKTRLSTIETALGIKYIITVPDKNLKGQPTKE